MSCVNKSKWLLSLTLAILFVVVANPFSFRLTGMFTKVFGLTIANDEGCPNLIGIAIHALIFFLLVRLILFLCSRENYWAPPLEGRQFMGLVDGADMLEANTAQLSALQATCPECACAMTTCMGCPTSQACYEAKKGCNPQTCSNPYVINQVHAVNIKGTPQYTNNGMPSANCRN